MTWWQILAIVLGGLGASVVVAMSVGRLLRHTNALHPPAAPRSGKRSATRRS
jgi:hypothetical protein